MGLMSGTSADGVDAALLYTDGREIIEVGAALTVEYSDALRAAILGLMKGKGNLREVERDLTDVHLEAIAQLRTRTKEPIGLIGFHGQTIRHAPKQGITQQIGDARRMAKTAGIPVIADFRSNDVRQGGQGAPLVPLFHAVLAQKLEKPAMVVNIGGVANVTWIGPNAVDGAVRSPKGEPERSERGGAVAGAGRTPSRSDQLNILAFDCGPGNALIDDWVGNHTKERFDKEGRLASRGKADSKIVAKFLNDPFFTAPAPKSLDRHHFNLDMVHGLSVEDGAATLTVMTAGAIAKACELVPQKPKQLLIAGGGRLNPTLMVMITSYAHIPAVPVEAVDWYGDMLEAQAFAYLAARSFQGLALTLPTTTGVARPVTGGVFYPA